MADGSRGGPDRGPFSKRTLLEAAAQAGGVYTARMNGEELPFDGAPFYARELEREGCLSRFEDPPAFEGVEDYQLWTITSLGKLVANGGGER
jgi:hypothetical protein